MASISADAITKPTDGEDDDAIADDDADSNDETANTDADAETLATDIDDANDDEDEDDEEDEEDADGSSVYGRYGSGTASLSAVRRLLLTVLGVRPCSMWIKSDTKQKQNKT